MKKKIGEIYNKPIVIGNKNEVTKNEVHISNLNVQGEGGGSASNMKYYSCLPDYFLEEEHEVSLVDSVKVMLEEDGSTIIAPESVYNWGSFSPVVGAVAIDADNRRCYVDGEWITMKEYAQRFSGFNVDTHYEISEEEYYRIPDALIMENEKELALIYESVCERLAFAGISPAYVDFGTGSTEDIDYLNIPVQFFGYSSIGATVNSDEWRSVTFGKYFTTEGIGLHDYFDKQDYNCKSFTGFIMFDEISRYQFSIGKAELTDGATKHLLTITLI